MEEGSLEKGKELERAIIRKKKSPTFLNRFSSRKKKKKILRQKRGDRVNWGSGERG